MLSNKLYDRLKWLAQIALPATGSLYFGLAQIWGFPYAEEIPGSILVVDTFLGILLGVSSKSYNNDPSQFAGYLDSSGVDPDTGNPDLRLVITTPPEEILSSDTVRLKIGPAPVR